MDQLTFTLRYVKDAAPIERFLQFVPIHGDGAEHLEKVVLNFFQENDISISDCREESYDNASNMAGQYSGLQKRINDKSESDWQQSCRLLFTSNYFFGFFSVLLQIFFCFNSL